MDHTAMLLDHQALTASNIHPTAIVAPGAQVAPSAVVGPWCSVGPDAVLEAGVKLISHVVVDGHTVIGEGAVIYPFVTIGMAPQDLKYKGEPTETVIGARTQIREHCTVHRGTVTGNGITRVGSDCLLMAVVHIAHDCTLGNNVVVANNVVMGGHVTIGDYAVIGGASALHQFVRIGRGAMIGGASGVDADVVPFSTVLGNRAYLSGLNLVGLKRRGVDRAGLHRLRAAFRTIFVGEDGTVFAERVARVRAETDDVFVLEMLDFIESSSRRGLVRHMRRMDDQDLG